MYFHIGTDRRKLTHHGQWYAHAHTQTHTSVNNK